MTSNKRIAYIDALRGFAMFLVVYLHITSWGGFPIYGNIVGEVFGTFYLPLFFFISGYLLYKEQSYTKQETIKVLARKSLSYLVPMVVFSLLYSVARELSLSLYCPIYWFMLVLIEMYAIYYLIRFITNNESLFIGVLAAISIIGVSLITFKVGYGNKLYELLCLENLLKYFQFFTVGIIAKRYNDVYERVLRSSVINIVAIVAFIVAITLVRSYNAMECSPIIGGLMRSIISRYAGLFIIVSLFYRYKDFFSANGPVSRTVQLIGKRTIDIYMIHYFLLSYSSMLVTKIMELNYIPFEVFAISILALLNIAVCLLLSECIRNSKFLAKYLFGAKTA